MSRLDHAKSAAVAALIKTVARPRTCGEMKAAEDRLRMRREAQEARNAERYAAAEVKLAAKQESERAKLTGRFERETKVLATQFGCAGTPRAVSKASTPRVTRAPRALAAHPPTAQRPDYVRDDVRATWTGKIVAIYSPFVADNAAREVKGVLLRSEGFRWSEEEHRWRRKASEAAWAAATRVVDQLAEGAPAAVAEVLAETSAPASTRKVFAEFEFDDTKCTIFVHPPGYRVRVAEGGLELELDTVDGTDLFQRATEALSSMLGEASSPNAIRDGGALVDPALRETIRRQNRWKADRVVYVFSLAARRIAKETARLGRRNAAAPRVVAAARRTPAPAATTRRARMGDTVTITGARQDGTPEFTGLTGTVLGFRGSYAEIDNLAGIDGSRWIETSRLVPLTAPAPAPEVKVGRVYGNSTEVVLQSARGALKVVPARFVLMSASSLIPSHDSQTFDPRPDYPANVQERRYEVDRNEQLKVTGVAQDMHPGLLQSTSTGAVDGTPVIAAGDAPVVLGGNGRSMGAQRHYKSGRTVLRDYVVEHAGEFGIDARLARKIEDPIIVREVDVPRVEWPRMVRDLNVTLTQTMDADTEAAAQARQLPPDVIRTLAAGLAQGEVGEFLRSRASLGLVGALERSGFINRSNRGRMVGEDGLLSREAMLQLERQLLALLVPDTGLLERLGLEVRGTLNRSAPLCLAAAANGPQWDLREPLLAALGDLRTMRHDNQCLAQWLQQASFGRGTTDNSMGRLLLEILDLAGGKPVVFSKVARAYFEASSGGGLFGGGVAPMQALSEAAVGAGINPASAVSKKRCKR